jgi:hypothetical protein
MILLVIGTRRIGLLWKTIPFLVFDMCGSTVFLKTELFFLVHTVSFQETHPTLLLQAQCILLLRIAVCSLISRGAWGVKFPDRPIAVSCHSSSAWFLVSLLLPLLFLLRSSSDRLQVLDLCSSTKLRIAEDWHPHQGLTKRDLRQLHNQCPQFGWHSSTVSSEWGSVERIYNGYSTHTLFTREIDTHHILSSSL